MWTSSTGVKTLEKGLIQVHRLQPLGQHLLTLLLRLSAHCYLHLFLSFPPKAQFISFSSSSWPNWPASTLGRGDAQGPQGSCLIPCIHHWAASPIVSTTNRKKSSKDPNSDPSQLLNSQEFLNDYFSDHKAFSSYGISGASWWHKVTPDEHK